jgi:uncharacterized membrane protein YdjX (TVP38/TMEM64 family)
LAGVSNARPGRGGLSAVASSLWRFSARTARTAKGISRTRLIGALVLVAAAAAAVAFVPLPTTDEMRGWARELGPFFPAAFLLAHVVVTVFPIPRTLFSISAGLLFGVVPGVAIAVGASTVSAVIALLLARSVGRSFVSARLTVPALQEIDARLSRRGWLAVGSLRLMAPIPFSVLNYCCGLSSVRLLPYTLATAVGLLPGTIGIVLLADVVAGDTDPRLLVVSGICLGLGLIGLVVDSRLGVKDEMHVPHPHLPHPHRHESSKKP